MNGSWPAHGLSERGVGQDGPVLWIEASPGSGSKRMKAAWMDGWVGGWMDGWENRTEWSGPRRKGRGGERHEVAAVVDWWTEHM